MRAAVVFALLLTAAPAAAQTAADTAAIRRTALDGALGSAAVAPTAALIGPASRGSPSRRNETPRAVSGGRDLKYLLRSPSRLSEDHAVPRWRT